ncbi:unnamed protein product [Bursaphelenchus xylophilus]|uniref:Fucosyltransferase n=1 Tax=Bursaphelenchus xylophilus TaxID=6326 RepID=A0A1I7SUW1_BURXY|nr:unnamed protein product [Bursaphelenchus xylophilus]CAG9125821.1 unnamed protein product [Bursaphelenchus xylophilus]
MQDEAVETDPEEPVVRTYTKIQKILWLLVMCVLLFGFVLFTVLIGHFSRDIAAWSQKKVTAKTILLWNDPCKTCGQVGYENGTEFSDLLSDTCGKKCVFVSDWALQNSSDAVIVFPRTIENVDNKFPNRSFPTQKLVLFEKEPPSKDNTQKSSVLVPDGLFNWVASYVPDADIVLPYGRLVKRLPPYKHDRDFKDDLVDIVNRKTDGVFAYTTNCGTNSNKERIFEELRKYIQVDVYSKCGNSSCDSKCFKSNLKKYRFYLAFESTVCDNYVTEKFFRTDNKIVPVVLRRKDYLDFGANHDFIALDDFPNPASLANYLKELMQDNDAYMKYFEWSKEWKKITQPLPYSLCSVCDYIHQPSRSRSVLGEQSFSDWYSPKRRCDSDFIDDFLNPDL